jgi:hypothetical protein
METAIVVSHGEALAVGAFLMTVVPRKFLLRISDWMLWRDTQEVARRPRTLASFVFLHDERLRQVPDPTIAFENHLILEE